MKTSVLPAAFRLILELLIALFLVFGLRLAYCAIFARDFAGFFTEPTSYLLALILAVFLNVFGRNFVLRAVFKRNFVSYFANPTGYLFICASCC